MSVTINTEYMHIADGHLHRTMYNDGSLALQIESTDENGYPEVETLSVNLSAYDAIPPEDHIYVKDYEQSRGLADALVTAGVAEKVDTVYFGPFNSAFILMKLVSA